MYIRYWLPYAQRANEPIMQSLNFLYFLVPGVSCSPRYWPLGQVLSYAQWIIRSSKTIVHFDSIFWLRDKDIQELYYVGQSVGLRVINFFTILKYENQFIFDKNKKKWKMKLFFPFPIFKSSEWVFCHSIITIKIYLAGKFGGEIYSHFTIWFTLACEQALFELSEIWERACRPS
jgi:hypothetical protein